MRLSARSKAGSSEAEVPDTGLARITRWRLFCVRALPLIGLLWLFFSGTAPGHVGFHGGTVVRLYGERTEVTMRLLAEDVSVVLPGQEPLWDSEAEARALPVLRERAVDFYEVTATSGLLKPRKVDVTLEGDGYFLFVIDYPPVTLPFRVRVVFAEKLGEDFEAPISVFDLRNDPQAGESMPIAGAIQTGNNTVLEVAEPQAADAAPRPAQTTGKRPTFQQFLRLGIKHILTGYDHLLFLLALLVVCHRVKPMLAIITSFTLAHSLTLALAALDTVRVPGKIVEPMIAASIVFVGLENILRGEVTKERAWVAFGFGLIHGLGFAGVLREIGLGADGSPIALPLFSFNLGVEIGQICVAAIVLPVFWTLRGIRPIQSYVSPAISVAVVLAGTFWLLERLWPLM